MGTSCLKVSTGGILYERIQCSLEIFRKEKSHCLSLPFSTREGNLVVDLLWQFPIS